MIQTENNSLIGTYDFMIEYSSPLATTTFSIENDPYFSNWTLTINYYDYCEYKNVTGPTISN